MSNKPAKFLTLFVLLYSSVSFAEEISIPGDTDKPEAIAEKEVAPIPNVIPEKTKEEANKTQDIKKDIEAIKEKPAVVEEKAEEEKTEEKIEEVKEEKSEDKVEEKAEDKNEEAEPAEADTAEKTDTADKADAVIEETKDSIKGTSVASILNGGTTKIEGITLSKNILSEIYAPRNNKAIWFDGTTPNANYEKAVKFIALADENGLNRRYFDYHLIQDRVESGKNSKSDVAETDILITQFVSELIQQVGNGQEIPKEIKLETFFERPVRVTNSAKTIKEFLDSENGGEDVLEKYQPKNPQYAYLKKGLRDDIAKAGSSRGIKPIRYTHDIYPGSKDHNISEIRTRLGVRRSSDPSFEADVYDKALISKVSSFQTKFKQKSNGIINEEFITALNSHDVDNISRIKANMERYRWLKDGLEPVRVEVNLADFTMHVYRDGKLDFDMSVIAGHKEHKTPIMSTSMYQFVMNPYWTPPKAYFFRNMLPLLKGNPTYAKDQNFDLMQMTKDGWKTVEQKDLDLNKITPDNYNIMMRERPGNLNVLGPIKFFINNPYDIFLHFTSEPWLFTNKNRGYSSGCIRLEDPIKFVKFLREETGVEITDEKFMELFNAYQSKDGVALPQKKEYNEKYFKFKKALPTYTTYFTAHADEEGNITLDDDIYDLDFDMSRYLGL